MTDVERLASESEADSVTAARLRGEEKYFPDCRPHLQSGQQPEHLILLSTSGVAMRAKQENEEAHPRELRFKVSDGVVVLTGNALLAVLNDDVVELPHATAHAVVSDGPKIEVHARGLRYRFNVAKSADEDEVEAGFGYLRRRVRETHA